MTGEKMGFMRCPQRLRQPLIDCHRTAMSERFLVDNKRQAYMRRVGGIIVLADPFVVDERFHKGSF
jgi:hypothetical protein